MSARFEPLRACNHGGTYRWCTDFAATCGTGYRERTDTTAEDRACGHNRTEHLRQHVKTDGDSVYDRCYGWREDSESLNNTLDRTLYRGRTHAQASRGPPHARYTHTRRPDRHRPRTAASGTATRRPGHR